MSNKELPQDLLDRHRKMGAYIETLSARLAEFGRRLREGEFAARMCHSDVTPEDQAKRWEQLYRAVGDIRTPIFFLFTNLIVLFGEGDLSALEQLAAEGNRLFPQPSAQSSRTP